MSVDTDSQSSHYQGHALDPEMATKPGQDDGESRVTEGNLEVFWDEPADQDPTNPLNWGTTRKWLIIAMVSFTTFLT